MTTPSWKNTGYFLPTCSGPGCCRARAAARQHAAGIIPPFPPFCRQKRLAELRRAAATPRFGTVESIRGSEFVAQVTEASRAGPTWVVCLLYKEGNTSCQLLGSCLQQLAHDHTATKFVRIISTDAIPKYPDVNLPTLLLYRGGACKATLVGLRPFGGAAASPERVALTLNGFGAVCAADGQDEVEAAEQAVRGMVLRLVDEGAVGRPQRGSAGRSDDEG